MALNAVGVNSNDLLAVGAAEMGSLALAFVAAAAAAAIAPPTLN